MILEEHIKPFIYDDDVDVGGGVLKSMIDGAFGILEEPGFMKLRKGHSRLCL